MAQTSFPLTRSDALQRLETFVPDAGAAYARLRNRDRGQGAHLHVSRLSAALRRRLVSEREVVDAVVARHGLSDAEKFVSEVFWRSYWKGWLEQRRSIWPAYREALAQADARMHSLADLQDRHSAAADGRTGIDCFDAWVGELEATGYLHNWARMQFASIWIFTLGLPWELGAAFMFDRLIDADPASNTLSWRWVAGLHTAGKAYLADAERIRAMTDGRYNPKGLARIARIPPDSVNTPQPSALRQRRQPDLSASTLLLITAEDLSIELIEDLHALPVKAIAFIDSGSAWDKEALEDGLARARRVWPDAPSCGGLQPADVCAVAQSKGCPQVVTAYLPVGPLADAMEETREQCSRQGMVFAEYLRDWDRLAWPHCRKGFFALKEKIPAIVEGGSGRHGL